MIKNFVVFLLLASQAFATSVGPTPAIDNAIVDGVTNRAPSQNAVFDALAGLAPAGNYITALTGDVGATGPGSVTATIQPGVVSNAKLANSAVTDAKVSASAAITRSKLASGSAFRLVTNDTSGVMADAAAITSSRALASDANGIPTHSATTSAELAFLSGVTSSVQTQLNGKQATGNYITATTGDVVATGPGSVSATIQAGAVTNTKLASNAVTDVKVDAAAAITRSKLASGTASHVVINDPSGVMSSEATLATSRGGTNIATWTTGDIPYSSATNVLSKLPAGSTGQIIRYVGGVPVTEDQNNPAAQNRLYEDWIGDAVGQLRWLDADTGVGVSATSLTVADSNHPGVLDLNTTGASGAAIRTLGGVTTGAVTSGFIVGGGSLMFEMLVRLSTLATAGEDYNFLVGLSDSATANVNYIGISYQRSVNATNWICKTVSASTTTNTDTGVAVAAGVWVKLAVTINAAGTSVGCAFNGVTAVSNTTNIPTVTVAPQLRAIKTAGAAAISGYVEYFKLFQRYTVTK